jgi:hypothetical protein
VALDYDLPRSIDLRLYNFDDEKWREQAACANTYPQVDMMLCATYQEARALIKEYCAICPVILECGEYALSKSRETIGIWGGCYVPLQHKRKALQALEAACARLRMDAA